MHAFKSSQLKVLLVFGSFVSLAMGGLWVLGGRPIEISVEIHSSLPSSVLSQRFERHCQQLPPLKHSTSGVTPRRLAISAESVGVVHALPAGLVGVGTTAVPVPLADVVLGAETGGRTDFDPTMVFTDPEFHSADSLEFEWYGRDEQYIYLREFDNEHRVRLVKLAPDQVEFTPAPGGESEGCLVTYVVVMQHTGWRRLYGAFFTRGYEELTRTRLTWICRQLESQP
jgi:hypothetical protein